MKRNAKLHQCGTCRAWVLTGHDADIAAIEVTIDVAPIPATHEWRALAAGRPTYNLVGYPKAPEIQERTHWRIQANRDTQVWVTHKCAHQMRPAEIQIPINFDAFTEPNNDTAPF